MSAKPAGSSLLRARRAPSRLESFAVSPSGFEDLVGAELRSCAISDVAEIPGGVRFTGCWADVYRANLLSRVASRVLVRVARFEAASFAALEHGLRAIDWQGWLGAALPIDVRVAKHRTRLYHTGKVADVVRGVLEGCIAPECGVADREFPPQQLHLRIDGPEVTVSIDTSGDHLHRRGYRPETGHAPLRENVAAGLLLRAGWTGSEPLLDPLCGSGTIPIEAALLALGVPPGIRRRFAFESLPSFDERAWSDIRSGFEARIRSSLAHPVFASDSDPEAIHLTTRSARRAGLAEHLQVAVADLADLEPPAETGLLVTNPPWGLRLGGERSAYAAFGRALRDPFRAWRWGVVGKGADRGRTLGLRTRQVSLFQSGGVRLWFAQGDPGARA